MNKIFKYAIIGELIIIISLIICFCNIYTLNKENDALKEQIEDQQHFIEQLWDNQ